MLDFDAQLLTHTIERSSTIYHCPHCGNSEYENSEVYSDDKGDFFLCGKCSQLLDKGEIEPTESWYF